MADDGGRPAHCSRGVPKPGHFDHGPTAFHLFAPWKPHVPLSSDTVSLSLFAFRSVPPSHPGGGSRVSPSLWHCTRTEGPTPSLFAVLGFSFLTAGGFPWTLARPCLSTASAVVVVGFRTGVPPIRIVHDALDVAVTSSQGVAGPRRRGAPPEKKKRFAPKLPPAVLSYGVALRGSSTWN